MNTRTITKNLELTPAISDYIKKKLVPLERLLKNAPPETLIDVEVGKDAKHHRKGEFRAEMSIKLSDKRIYAEAYDDDLYAAIDKVKDEILTELKKNIKKKRDVEYRQDLKIKKIVKRLKN